MTKFLLITFIISLVIYLITKFLINRRIPIITMEIGTENGTTYNLQLNKANKNIADIEYVRFVLWFLGKILFVIPEKDSNEFMYSLDEILELNFNVNTLIKRYPQISIQEGIIKGKIIKGFLYSKDLHTRYLITKIPNNPFKSQYHYSFLLLFKYVYDIVGEEEKKSLVKSLKYMSTEYSKDKKNIRSFKVMNTLPNEAFFS